MGERKDPRKEETDGGESDKTRGFAASDAQCHLALGSWDSSLYVFGWHSGT